MRADRKEKKEKLSHLKEHEAWLYARDIVAHAIERHCYEIHLEDLRAFKDISGQWDFAKIVSCVANEAELFGISVFVVNPKDTSHENPFTGEICPVRDDRQMVLDSDDTIDRDLGAGLNAAYRKVRGLRVGATKTHGSGTSKGSQRFLDKANAAKEEREARSAVKAKKEEEKKSTIDAASESIDSKEKSKRVDPGDGRCRPLRDGHVGDKSRRPKRSCFPRECLASMRALGADGSGAFNSVTSSGQPTKVEVHLRVNRNRRTATGAILVPECTDLESSSNPKKLL
jgi:IS605 OrfB family transposase